MSSAQTPEEILASAERFARHDPEIEWPSSRHADPVDAICAALDELRERYARSSATDHAATAAGHLERADDWANRDGPIERDFRAHKVEYHLRLAQVHATLAVAEAGR